VPDLTSERLACLRALAAGSGDVVPLSPDVVTALLNEIERLRAVIQDVRDEGEPINNTWGACSWCAAHLEGGADHKPDCAWPQVMEATDQGAGPSTMVTSGDMAVELPVPTDCVPDLMEALEQSITAAKEARQRQSTERRGGD